MRTPNLFSYLPVEVAEALCKVAEESANKKVNALKPLLAGVLGMGAGTLAGAGAAHYVNKAHQQLTGKGIPSQHLLAALPILGGGLGLAYNLAQSHQMEAMKRDLESPKHDSTARDTRG